MPLQVVQCVTGHPTVAVVMKHYFRPGRGDFRTAIFKAMPKMLADGGQRSVKEQLRVIVERTSARTWQQDGGRLLNMIAADNDPGFA